jgi:hypothetical protein
MKKEDIDFVSGNTMLLSFRSKQEEGGLHLSRMLQITELCLFRGVHIL